MAKAGERRRAGAGGWGDLGQRLREHDWLPVLIEFLILVAGVFLGLQADNWNKDREDRERVQAYLTRLHDDLSSGIADQKASFAFIERARSFAEQALGHAENGRLVEGSAWKTLIAYYQGGQYYGNQVPEATFREMTSAGDLRLLEDPQLSAALGTFYISHSNNEARMFGDLPPYRETIRELVPSAVQRHIWDHCYLQLNTVRQEMVECPPAISENEAARILATIAAHPDAVGELRYWLTQMRVQSNVIAAERQSAEKVLAMVGKART